MAESNPRLKYLLEAVEKGIPDMVQELIEKKGLDVNSANAAKKTILMIAAENGHLEIVNYLLEKGADATLMDTSGRIGRTARDYAEMNGHTEILERIDAHLAGGKMAHELVDAAKQGDMTRVQELIAAGKSVDEKDETRRTALMWAAVKGDAAMTALLLENGAKVDEATFDERTALWFAAAEGKMEIVNMLIDAKASVNVWDSGGQTHLFIAAAAGHTEIVKLLLENRAGPNYATESGLTPLMAASSLGDEKAVKVLLDKGADPELQDRHGMTALSWASQTARGEKVVPLLKAALAEAQDRKEREAIAAKAANNPLGEITERRGPLVIRKTTIGTNGAEGGAVKK